MWNGMCFCRVWGWESFSFPSPHHSGMCCVGSARRMGQNREVRFYPSIPDSHRDLKKFP